MSIDHWILVDANAKSVSGKVYNRMICTEIIEELQAKGSSSWGNHSVYIMQGGIEYMYVYKDAAMAQADFEEWRRQPLENIRLKIDGVTQLGGRLPLQCDGCGKQIPEGPRPRAGRRPGHDHRRTEIFLRRLLQDDGEEKIKFGRAVVHKTIYGETYGLCCDY